MSDNLSAWPYQLTNDARLMAEQLGLMPLINEYIQLKNQIPATERSKNAQLQSLRQDITDIILTTMLEVQSVTSKINLEISQGDDIRNYLKDKRDRAMKYNAIANIVAGAVSNVIGVSLQVPNGLPEMPGEIVELTGGGGQMAFGTLALMQQDGGKQRLQARPNMLAKLFDRPIAPNAEYPPNIWAYVNSPVEGSKLTKRTQLIEGWKQVGLLPDPKKGTYNNQVLMLTGTASGRYHLTLDLIEDRAIMLADLRAVLSQMDSNLLELMLFMKKS
ncbi:MAG: hypothetical protein K2Y22_09580 [Candidatus Obscuribacterales bacterium]|nr:hypothetical protein [Candidatus Obscuribacterales bacterium]